MTIAEIRQTWWIPNARQRVKTRLRKCAICKKVSGKSYVQQPISPLPDFRVNKSRPFEVVGLDYTVLFLLRLQKVKRKFMLLFSHVLILELFT